MVGQKVCKSCKFIAETSVSICPNCGSSEFAENFKGKIMILNSEQSELAKNLKISKKGSFAIKIG